MRRRVGHAIPTGTQDRQLRTSGAMNTVSTSSSSGGESRLPTTQPTKEMARITGKPASDPMPDVPTNASLGTNRAARMPVSMPQK